MTTTPRNRRRRPDVLHAAALVTAALETFAEAVDAEPEFTALLEFDNGLQQAYELGASGLARTEAAMLREAWHLIDTEVPVAAGYPVRSWFDGPQDPIPARLLRRWHASLTPSQVLDLADLAEHVDPPATLSFHEQLAENHQVLDARFAGLEAQCGRPARHGGLCAALPVYLPPHGHQSGQPCYLHQTPAEQADAIAVYDTAVAEHACPGCDAEAGVTCRVPDNNDYPRTNLVNGAWPRLRSFKGRKVHDVRLLLVR